jgi:hypothetical protein
MRHRLGRADQRNLITRPDENGRKLPEQRLAEIGVQHVFAIPATTSPNMWAHVG